MLSGMAGRVSSPVFVGRQAELDAAADALDRALAGQAIHLLVAGEAGVGKTRYTDEVAQVAASRRIPRPARRVREPRWVQPALRPARRRAAAP